MDVISSKDFQISFVEIEPGVSGMAGDRGKRWQKMDREHGASLLTVRGKMDRIEEERKKANFPRHFKISFTKKDNGEVRVRREWTAEALAEDIKFLRLQNNNPSAAKEILKLRKERYEAKELLRLRRQGLI